MMSTRFEGVLLPWLLNGARSGVKFVLDIDINTPPFENLNEVGTCTCGLVHLEVGSAHQGAPPQPVTIHVDSPDDNGILCFTRASEGQKTR